MLARLGRIALLTWLTACAGERASPPPPKAQQPSVLDRAVEPVVKQIGGRIGPQGGILIPTQPKP